MDATTMAPPVGYTTNQQGGAPVMVISQQAAGGAGGNHYRPPSGHVGPVIGVLSVIAVLGILAGLVGRLCSGRTVMGYGPRFDVEAWLESKCSSCLDGHVAPPRTPHHPHMHMNTHVVMESFPAAVPSGSGSARASANGGGRRIDSASLRPHPQQMRPQTHLNPELLLRPLPIPHQGPVGNKSSRISSPTAGRPEPEIRTLREQQEGQRHRPPDDVVHQDEDTDDDDDDDVSDFSHDEDELQHRQYPNPHHQHQHQHQHQHHEEQPQLRAPHEPH